MTKICFRYRNIDMPFIDIGWMVGVWVGGILCKGDQESHVILYISDKNGTSKLNKLTIFDQKWNFWNLVAMFDKQQKWSQIFVSGTRSAQTKVEEKVTLESESGLFLRIPFLNLDLATSLKLSEIHCS